MGDLLTPKEVREIDDRSIPAERRVREDFHRLCHDYLTLWDRNLHLENTIDTLRELRKLES